LAQEWFAICGGCEVTILDVGEPLLDILPQLEIVHMPVLMDHKIYGQTGEGAEPEIPEADIGIITGGIRNEENKRLAQEMRRKCKTLIAMGSCACYGGVPALANLYTVQELYEKVYRESVSTDPDGIPSEQIPPLTDRVYAVHEVVPVDIKLPGCPTTPELFVEALTALLEGKPFALSGKSVCDECPLIREKKAVSALKRPLEPIEFTPGEPLNTVRCIMEQGYLCLGPATKAGCGGKEGVPRCIRAYMPCRGCFGPLSDTANPMVDMMGALASIGLDAKQIPDRAATFNRYAGAQGRLRPTPKGGRPV
ncbi:MAG: methyl viologen-reducing hydrogenase, partial [Blastocatellia bacterium]|nr:methyl viologen-reducing hydrogenase [Blastocatellia bacterium]